MLSGFKEKYRSYGCFTGTVKLRNISSDEIEALEGFFAKNFHGQESISVSAEKFRKALGSGRFSSVTPERLLEMYFNEKIVGKKAEQEEAERVKELTVKKWKDTYRGTPAEAAEDKITELLRALEPDKERWEKYLYLCADIINALPYRNGELQYLSVFAAQMTGDPHAFDKGSYEGNLLYQIVTLDIELRGMEIKSSDIFPAYKRQRSYLEAGIMIDDVSNYTMLYGVRGFKKDGEPHTGIEGFYSEHDMVQIPLAVLSKLERLECPDNRIFIVENPSVFAMLCAKERSSAYMCMNGQPRLAGLVALELLKNSDTEAYYAGDLDPEGLLIAQKLAKFYGSKLNFRNMSSEDFMKSHSGKKISQKRLKILENITDERLKPAAELIKKYQTAGYQELII